jgi:hypothetical protein
MYSSIYAKTLTCVKIAILKITASQKVFKLVQQMLIHYCDKSRYINYDMVQPTYIGMYLVVRDLTPHTMKFKTNFVPKN